MQLGIFPAALLYFTFRNPSTISARYPKRYPLLSEWIVARGVRNAYHKDSSKYAPVIRHRNSWHLDCKQLCHWPPTKGPANSCGTRSRSVGFRAQIFCLHCLPTVLQEIHDEATRGA